MAQDHFWTPPKAQGALHGGEESAQGPQAQIPSYTCSDRADRKVPKVTIQAFEEKM